MSLCEVSWKCRGKWWTGCEGAKGRDEGNFHLLRTRGECTSCGLASCADCTRERYRPTPDAASARHSYDRISNTTASARKRPLRYVQLASPVSQSYDRIIRGDSHRRTRAEHTVTRYIFRGDDSRRWTATRHPGQERRCEIDLRARKNTALDTLLVNRACVTSDEETMNDRGIVVAPYAKWISA